MSIFRKNKLIGTTVDPSSFYTREEVDAVVANKQDTLSADSPYTDSPADSDMLANVDLDEKRVKAISFSNVWKWILSKLYTNYINRTTQTTVAKYGSVNCGDMVWTCVKTKVAADAYHYHWFGRLQNTGFAFTANWSSWGQIFMSEKFRIPLPNSDMVGRCVFNVCVRNLTMFQAESFNVDNYLDFYCLRATQPSTSTTTLQITVHCDYVAV